MNVGDTTESKTTTHGVWTKNGETEPASELYKTNPSKYYYQEGRKAELELEFLKAAEMYTNAHVHARKEGRTSAIYYKWYAMRCIEYDEIYQRLLQQVDPVAKCGRKLKDGSSMVTWAFDTSVLDAITLRQYRDKVPPAFYNNVMIWNPSTEEMKFVNCDDYYNSSEPVIKAICTVTKKGSYYIEELKEKKVLLHKWMLSAPANYNMQDRRVQIRRSIRIEFLKLPPFMQMTEFPRKDFWDKYVAPAIGNRNVGKLQKEYSDYLVGLSNETADKTPAYYSQHVTRCE